MRWIGFSWFACFVLVFAYFFSVGVIENRRLARSPGWSPGTRGRSLERTEIDADELILGITPVIRGILYHVVLAIAALYFVTQKFVCGLRMKMLTDRAAEVIRLILFCAVLIGGLAVVGNVDMVEPATGQQIVPSEALNYP